MINKLRLRSNLRLRGEKLRTQHYSDGTIRHFLNGLPIRHDDKLFLIKGGRHKVVYELNYEATRAVVITTNTHKQTLDVSHQRFERPKLTH